MIESVIWPIIMFLKDPDIETYPSTKTTPMVMREAVNRVLLLYRRRLRMAILKRLPIVLPPLDFFPDQFPVFQGVDDLSLPHDLLVVGGENESGLLLVAHLFHEFND